ncbi:uncharacterized protein LOC110674122 [Aedes aegypti]|uniref:Putative alpha amylase catalytic domain family found in maltase n=1 Tax=Aedes aegypti TaxID=7159 RepID=A0A0P6IY06_AEDAE|nr:uncharacterized protein LOC110674122 [Aedes aegypti]
MTINEKTRLLPKEYQKSYVIPMPQEDLNNNTNDSILQEYDSYALTKEELAKYIEDPFWNRVRYICFSLYWILCLAALLASCYLAVEALENGFCEVDGLGNGSTVLANDTTLNPTTLVTDPTTVGGVDDAGVVLRMISSQPS